MRRIRSHNEAGEEKEPKGKDCSHSDLIRQRAGHEKIKIKTAPCIPIDNWHRKAPCMADDISLWCELGIFLFIGKGKNTNTVIHRQIVLNIRIPENYTIDYVSPIQYLNS